MLLAEMTPNHVLWQIKEIIMPNPVTQDQTVTAINATLATMVPPGQPIDNLNTNAQSDPEWSCNNFSPTLLEQICTITNTPIEDLQTVEYPKGANNLPAQFVDATFVNISMMGEPSALNHNFNILVSGPTTYLIQVFVNNQVNIVQRFPNATFITLWHNLSNNVDWINSYDTLFGVAPGTVVEPPPAATWLTNQFVTQ